MMQARSSRCSEFAAGKQEKIQRLDANSDGVVTPNEASTPAKAEKKHWWSRSDKASNKANKMNDADTNGDGQITTAEATAHADQAFARMDSNADGYLSESELKAAHK
jgi:Ca2+-binding EF-hand superfamily protein